MNKNKPCEVGEQLGSLIATYYEDAEKFGDPCKTCAFRRGTFSNRCLTTTADALKCVVDCDPFLCHQDKGMPCKGWVAAAERALSDKSKPASATWLYTDELKDSDITKSNIHEAVLWLSRYEFDRIKQLNQPIPLNPV